jgi:hypothetical protein
MLANHLKPSAELVLMQRRTVILLLRASQAVAQIIKEVSAMKMITGIKAMQQVKQCLRRYLIT